MMWSLFRAGKKEEKRSLLPSSYGSHSHSCYRHDNEEENIKGDKNSRRKNYKMQVLLLFSFLGIITVVLTKPVHKKRSGFSFDYETINTIISFGDSYTTRYLDMDSLNYACRNCTSAGGPNWVIYLTDTTKWISWDFAYNSAPVNNSFVNQVPTVIDVSTQIRDLYQKIFVTPNKKISGIVKSVYKDMKRTPESTLTTVWVGINDIDLTFDWNQTSLLDSRIMQGYQALLNELILKGEKQFMLINVPPLDRAPMWHHTTNEQLIKTRVIDYNKKLTEMIHALRKMHSSAVIMEYDAWSFFNKLLNNASQFGITDIDTYCPDWSHPIKNNCKSVGEYFWLNDLHPTFHVHELLAKAITGFLQNV
ncbi:MAG: hypothetical protein EXX96DRAFT_563475 [Benjaminiella poitrasii]|nr:MAG: hypothetical protein EXX96DRAFT_563475 [Benjaminiella poitrasii]